MGKGNVSLRVRPITTCCCLFLICCFLSACATSADLEMVRQDVNRLQRESFATKEDLESLKEKTAGVAKEESFNILRTNQAEMESRLANMAKEVQVLSGRFEENKYSIEKAQKERVDELDLLKSQVASLERQVKEMKDMLRSQGQPGEHEAEAQGNAENASREVRKGTSAGEQASKPPAKSARLERYEAAYDAFKNKRYKESREKFEAFIKEFPADELTDNAYFWIAETYYNDGDFEGAILAYETFLKKYPKSQKAPGAFLKQGLSFAAIGDKKTAKVILQQLIERYPDSNEAALAHKRIKDIDRRNPKRKK